MFYHQYFIEIIAATETVAALLLLSSSNLQTGSCCNKALLKLPTNILQIELRNQLGVFIKLELLKSSIDPKIAIHIQDETEKKNPIYTIYSIFTFPGL